MYTLIPLCAEKHKSYCGRVLSLQGLFSPVAKFCSWETSGGEQSTSLAWIRVRTAKRLLLLTRKATLNQWKMSKADFHSNLPLYFFDKLHMVLLANSWCRTSYLPADLNPPLSCFFPIGFCSWSPGNKLFWDSCLLTTPISNHVNAAFLMNCIFSPLFEYQVDVFLQEPKKYNWISGCLFGIWGLNAEM